MQIALLTWMLADVEDQVSLVGRKVEEWFERNTGAFTGESKSLGVRTNLDFRTEHLRRAPYLGLTGPKLSDPAHARNDFATRTRRPGSLQRMVRRCRHLELVVRA